MCPACLANAAVLAGGVVLSGGITAVALKVFGLRRNVSEKNETIGISTGETKRRNDDGYGD
jgi:hypothetical protein